LARRLLKDVLGGDDMQLRIALPGALIETVGVYVCDPAGELRDCSLDEIAARWIASKLDDPLRGALLQCMDSPACSIDLADLNALPALPPGALIRAGEGERRRYACATSLILVRAFQYFEHPLLGVLFARAVSQALVEATGGVAVEPAIPRLRAPALRRAFSHDASIALAQFVDVLELSGIDGVMLRTAGMARFGLPDFSVNGASERAAPALRWFLLGIGQYFLNEALRCRDAGLDSIRCWDEIVVDGEDVALALGKHTPAMPPEVLARFSWVSDGLIRVEAPRGAGAQAAWLDLVPDLLFGMRRSA
jgi:hypothetical protein